MTVVRTLLETCLGMTIEIDETESSRFRGRGDAVPKERLKGVSDG